MNRMGQERMEREDREENEREVRRGDGGGGAKGNCPPLSKIQNMALLLTLVRCCVMTCAADVAWNQRA